MMSGGSRSFSMSLFRLIVYQLYRTRLQGTYASSKPCIASLIPSAPDASIPAGNVPFPAMLLSSDTRSDSSLRVKHISAEEY